MQHFPSRRAVRRSLCFTVAVVSAGRVQLRKLYATDCCTHVQDAATFWKAVEAFPASLLAPLKPFNHSASSGGQIWNPLQPKKNVSGQPFGASQALAAPYANPNPDNGNPKWKLPVPLNSSHSLAAAADNAPAPAPVPSMLVPLSEHAAPQPSVSSPTSAAALAEAVNLKPDNGNPKYKLPVPLNTSDHLGAKADNATGALLLPNVTVPLSELKNVSLPPVSGPSSAEAAAAQAIREQQAKLAAALGQAANAPALAAHPLNASAHNSTIPVSPPAPPAMVLSQAAICEDVNSCASACNASSLDICFSAGAINAAISHPASHNQRLQEHRCAHGASLSLLNCSV